jgi:hypothetical protein
MAVLTACLGAGTGGGAYAEIVKALRDMGITTICFVTQPFGFEGEERRKAAERVLPMIERTPIRWWSFRSTICMRAANARCWRRPSSGGTRLRRGHYAGLGGSSRSRASSGWTPSASTPWCAGRQRALRLRLGGGATRAADAAAALRGCRLLRSADALAQGECGSSGHPRRIRSPAGRDRRGHGKLRAFCKAECDIEMGTVLDERFNGRIELVAVTFESWTAVAPVESGQAAAAAEPPVAEDFPIHSGRPPVRAERAANSRSARRDAASSKRRARRFQRSGHSYIPTFVRRGIQLDR